MVGVEFSKSNDNLDIVSLSNQMLERGFIIGVNPKANLIRFMPPLTIEEDEIAAMTENLNIVLQRTGK
jgi:4-aminobutyrate aminotransferase-like enzyme